jgi:hypothetical protein
LGGHTIELLFGFKILMLVINRPALGSKVTSCVGDPSACDVSS